MQIKILAPASGDAAMDSYVIEATAYSTNRRHCKDLDALMELTAEVGQFYAPFGIPDVEKGFKPCDVMVISINHPMQETIVVHDCFIWVMNNDGKTVDKETVL